MHGFVRGNLRPFSIDVGSWSRRYSLGFLTAVRSAAKTGPESKLPAAVDDCSNGQLFLKGSDQHLQTSCCFDHRSLVVMLLGHPGIGVLENGRRNTHLLASPGRYGVDGTIAEEVGVDVHA